MSPRLTRRQLFGSSALAATGLLATSGLDVGPASAAAVSTPFFHDHQAGIATPAQDHLVLATFDVGDATRAEVATVLDQWSTAAAEMTAGQPIGSTLPTSMPPADTGEALDLGPANLTMTIGFGDSFFSEQLANRADRPRGLVELPSFPGDQLDPVRSGGAIVLQACANDPQVAFHAVHTAKRLALGVLVPRAIQLGFGRTSATVDGQSSARNLLGFKDGTNNLRAQDAADMARYVWAGHEAGPAWMEGGTYLVNRRIRMRLELWGATSLEQQQAAVGRFRASGAPLSGTHEDDPVDLAATGLHDVPLIPVGAHIRVASPTANAGEKLLRRGFGFADGIDPVTGELDAGLVFLCFQRDPTAQFVAIQRRLSASDTLHRYLVHTASGLYAIPRGLERGQGWGSQVLA